MPQLNFEYNLGALLNNKLGIGQASLSFFPLNIRDSISWATMNIVLSQSAAGGKTNSVSIGLYSLNGSTLSLANSISASQTFNAGVEYYMSLTATSTAQNITPGTWWFGFLISTSGANRSLIGGRAGALGENAFPGSFIGGRMTASTAALPATVATSDLDITDSDAMFVPYILLSA